MNLSTLRAEQHGLSLIDSLMTASRPIAWSQGRAITAREFVADIAVIAQSLPKSGAMLNLCDDRYNFLLAFGAALCAGQQILLPPSRLPNTIDEIAVASANSYRFTDDDIHRQLQSLSAVPTSIAAQDNEASVFVFTSGSTAHSQPHHKEWPSLQINGLVTATAIRNALQLSIEGPTPWIVATVPPQHMYGMELSIVLPLVDSMAVHSSRPLFPADIARALAELPEPRILVSTPLHLRALVESQQSLPTLSGVISATAPLSSELARDVERLYSTVMFEVFGSTETGVIATRQTSQESAWRPTEGIELTPLEEGTRVKAPWLTEPMLLQDIIELLPGGRFIVRGRNTDLIEVAGKRASLSELTRLLLNVDGVIDAIVFPPQPNLSGEVRRVAALAVAPGLSANTVIERLSLTMDSAFLPRPLVLVDALPRNEIGKLPRDRLLKYLQDNKSHNSN
jgi:acyl-coenzyme A synthetase/AMP-(fatty) acid ligase